MYHGDVRLQTGPEYHNIIQRIVQYSTVQYIIVLYSSPRSEDFTTVRTGITVVFNSLVYDLDVPVQVTLLAEHFMTLRAGCRLVYLDVEVDLQDTCTH